MNPGDSGIWKRIRLGIHAACILTAGVLSAPGTTLLDHAVPRQGSWDALHDGPPRTLHGSSWIGVRPGSRFGEGLSAAGDVDGDGYADLWTGVSGAQSGEPRRGRAFLLFGSAEGLTGERSLTFVGQVVSHAFGRLIASGWSSDGAPMAALGFRPAAQKPGHLEFWTATGPRGGGSQAGWVLGGEPVPAPGDRVHQAGFPGDVDGDGRADLLVVCAVRGARAELEVRLYPGRGRSFSPEPVWRYAWPYREDVESRFALAFAGSRDGGRAGFCVGIPGGATSPGNTAGRVLLFEGRPAPEWVELVQELEPPPGADNAEFGASLVADADWDGDGRTDLLVGMPGHSACGRVGLYLGSPGGFHPRPAWILEGTHPDDRFGASMGVLPDFDGDSRVDLVVGAFGWNGRYLSEGCVCVVSSARVGGGPVDALPHLKLHGGKQGASFGRRVIAAGDINGDGLSDLAATSVEVGNRPNRAGRMEVVHGWPGALEGAVQFALAYPDPASVAKTRPGREPAAAPPAAAVRPWWVAPVGVAGCVGLVWGSRRWARWVRDRERRRIAEDLHDEIGVQLHRLGADPDSQDAPPSAVPAVATEAARAVRVGIERVIWSIDPRRRSWADLACGLTDLADEVLRDTGMQRRYDIREGLPQGEFEPAELNAVYRTAQEALTNIRKHSQASRVELRLAPVPEGLRLEIVDNGVGGCRPPDGRPVSGHGMNNMRARMRRLGGDCEWLAESGGGTRVVVTLPRSH